MENYEKIRLVGRGAHGTVYLCKQKLDSKLVILKEIPVDQMSVDERQASMIEAKVLAMLDHPNVVAYYESFLEDKTMIIVMEYVQGGTLFDFLQQRDGKLMTEKEILMFLGQMVYTLQYVHRKLILHRDLKSQNILLNENKNVVKIGDFGISKVLSSKSKAYTVVGTPYYISPELCEGKPYNQKSDIWALGCILYELMTLKRPFDATTLPALVMKIMKGSFDPVPDIYSSGLKQLLFSMLHLEPNHRPSAADIMSHPVMLKVIFNLYLEIGAIEPKRSDVMLPCETGNSTYFHSSQLCITSQQKMLPTSDELQLQIWLFDEMIKEPCLLPSFPKDVINYIALGLNHKIGLTKAGYLITWKTHPHIIISKHSDDFYENVSPPPINNPYIIDEKVAINIVSVSCGENFTICLSDDGVVYSFGKASSNCLGFLTEKDVEQPRIVQALFGHNISSIACGPRHVLAISENNQVNNNNQVFAWGYGYSGCLGLGSKEIQILPHIVPLDSKLNPIKVFCGENCSFIILEDLSVMTCGSNRHNKLAMDLGEGHQTEEVLKFTSIQVQPLSSHKIVSISSGIAHSVFLTDSGEIYSVGSNHYFQLGWGNIKIDYSMPQKVEKLNNINMIDVQCGDYFTLAISTDNYLYCWGKCPASLVETNESDVKIPLTFKEKYIYSVSCFLTNCLVIGRDR